MILRARIVLPVVSDPIDNGAVRIQDGKIVAVGPWSQIRLDQSGHEIVDLGENILLPGLVNGHCHLDFTDVAGKIPPTRKFSDWIKTLTSIRAEWSYSEYAQSWLNGARMLLQSGTTTVADIESIPELLPEAWYATPLRVFSFLEMTGVKSRQPPAAILEEALATLLPARVAGNQRVGLSPHAVYSTTPDLLKRTAILSRDLNLRLAIHVAESAEEFDLALHRKGPLFDWLKNQRSMDDCGLGSPVQMLERTGLLSTRLLAIHANYLAPGDAQTLAKHRASVVHCPRSHAFFEHQPFPCSVLADAAVNLCLGTDSLATTRVSGRQSPDLNLFTEMQQFTITHPEVTPLSILEMATRNPARALGLEGEIGELSPGARADLITIPFSGPIAKAHEGVLHHHGPVAASIIDGNWAWKSS